MQVLLVVLVYANSFGAVFQFDDYNVIVDLATVHSAQAWLADLGLGIRPLLKLSYVLNWLSGWEEAGFHAVNLLIHLGVVGLVYRLSQAFLQAHQLLQRLPHVPWLSALLFGLHPAHTEAVTYLCGRSSSLMALCYLGGLWVHARQANATGSRLRSVVPALCFVLALAVKETAVSFPLALMLWDLSCGTPWRAALRQSWASWLALLLGGLFFLFNTAYADALQRSMEFNSLGGNAATQLSGLMYLLGQWMLPLWLNIDPHLSVLPEFSVSLTHLACFLALLLTLFWSWRARPWLGFAVAWALLHLLLLHVFVPRLDVANDRQLYLAGWPLALALVVELQLRLPRRVGAGVVGLLLLSGALLTVLRNHDYRSEVALWEQTVRLSPNKSRVHANLGYAYKEAGRLVDARREYLRALQLDAGNVKARLNLRRLNAERATQQ
jgi:tetratricopeptide (TPR) repeat protein